MVNRLIILSVDFKIALRMRTYRADLRSLGSDNNMAAVPAFPDLDFALLKYFLHLYVLQQSPVTFLMVFFNSYISVHS